MPTHITGTKILQSLEICSESHFIFFLFQKYAHTNPYLHHTWTELQNAITDVAVTHFTLLSAHLSAFEFHISVILCDCL